MLNMKKMLCILVVAIIGFTTALSGFYTLADATLPGDCYKDNVLDINDVLYLRKHLAGYNMSNANKFYLDNCDYNKDGKVTIVDIFELRKYLAFEYSRTY